MITRKKLFCLGPLVAAALVCNSMDCQAYEVWMGTLGWQQKMHEHPENWARTAALVEGLNINWARGQADPERLDPELRDEVIALFSKAKFHASQVVPHGNEPITDESDWQRSFDRAESMGYKLEHLYTYNGGQSKTWSEGDHQLLRAWLDRGGHKDVKIAFNARAGHGQLERQVIQGGGIECDLQSWKDDKGGRHDLLRWMADPGNPAMKGEKTIIHCHLNLGKASDPECLVDVWAAARLMVRDIGRDVMNTPELKEVFRSDKMVFAFFGGNWTTTEITLLPETKDENTYAESYTGLLLSLLEQRDLFEGRSGDFPSDEQCRSFKRDSVRLKPSELKMGEQGGADQPATAPELKPDGTEKP
ncbi:MAG: hypothetical protein V4727_00180 [Verrucomicrobiota bacterium]